MDEEKINPKSRKTCDKCGRFFRCGVQGEEPYSCWCFSMDLSHPIESKYQDCLCPVCLKEYSDPLSLEEPPRNLKEGRDFSFNENGLMVLSKTFLWERGYCCQNHCLNCPFGYSRNATQI